MAIINKLHLGYSEYWRKNISAVETQELVRVLLALRKVGRHIASNLKPIEWRPSRLCEPSVIGIDINFVSGDYPVPPGKMDILVGITAREAFCCKILSDIVYLNIKKKLGEISENHEYLINLLIGIGEDIFIMTLAKETVWKYYLPKCWNYIRPPYKPNTSEPAILTFLYLFADYVFLDKLVVNMNPAYHDLFQIFLNAKDAIKNSINEISISKRSILRANIYLNLWHEILSMKWVDEEPFEKGVDLFDEESVFDSEQDNCDDSIDDMEPCEDTKPRYVIKESEDNTGLLQKVNDILEEMDEKSINQ